MIKRRSSTGTYIVDQTVDDIDSLERDQQVEHVVILAGSGRRLILDWMGSSKAIQPLGRYHRRTKSKLTGSSSDVQDGGSGRVESLPYSESGSDASLRGDQKRYRSDKGDL